MTYKTFAFWFQLFLSLVGKNVDDLFVLYLTTMLTFSLKQSFNFFIKDVTNFSPSLPLYGKSHQIFFLSSSSINPECDLFVSSRLITEFLNSFWVTIPWYVLICYVCLSNANKQASGLVFVLILENSQENNLWWSTIFVKLLAQSCPQHTVLL